MGWYPRTELRFQSCFIDRNWFWKINKFENKWKLKNLKVCLQYSWVRGTFPPRGISISSGFMIAPFRDWLDKIHPWKVVKEILTSTYKHFWKEQNQFGIIIWDENDLKFFKSEKLYICMWELLQITFVSVFFQNARAISDWVPKKPSISMFSFVALCPIIEV